MLYKTIWAIKEITTDEKSHVVKLVQYHFGKEPKFPSLFLMKEGSVYEIEMLWNLKIIVTPKTFWKCFTHLWICE